eukprot:gene8610-9489_t
MAFYMIANGWDLALSYYYAASVLLGALYLVPNEPNPYSPIFTQWYFLWGTTLIMGAIAAMANDFLRDQLLEAIGWQDHRNRYIVVMLAILWYLLGILYGVYYEHWDIYHAAFFSLSAMSASGTSPPVCEEEGGAAGGGGGSPSSTCRLGNMRSFLVGTYLLFGVPIFTYTMGQFAEILVERAIRARERELLMRPLSEEEFRFAMELQGDFIILELLRLQKISQHDLDYIKDLFRILDADGDGVLIHASVETRKPFTTSSSCSPSSSTPYQPTAATSLESPMDRRTKDLLQCRGQDVIHFLAPIREDYGSTTTTSPVTTPTPAPPGYNNLIIPVMRQMSMRPSAKMKTVKRSRTARSTVFTQLAARSKSTSPPPAAATPAAATPSLSTRAAWSRRKSQSAMIIHDENVPLLKHFVSESSMLS